MSFSEHYPELSQWLTYGGLLSVRPAGSTQVKALLGDAGGFPPDACCTAPTINELFTAIEQMAASWRRETYQLQQELLAEPLDDIQHEREIRVTGWPPVPNPTYDPTVTSSNENEITS